MTRPRGILVGALGALAVVLLMAPTGGWPSRPFLRSLGVGVAAPTTDGDVTQNATRDGTLQLVIDNDSNGNSNTARASISSGDASAALFVAGSGKSSAIITNGPTGAQAVLRTLGAYPIVFGTNNALALTIASGGAITAEGRITSLAAGGFANSHTAPRYCLTETDAAADETNWSLLANGGDLSFYANTDANDCTTTSAVRFFRVQRTGTTVDNAELIATTVTATGNLAVSGSLTVAGGTILPQVTAYKTSATDRSSTTTFSDDPALTMTLAASTRYQCQLMLKPQGITTGTQGFKWQANYTGTFTDSPTDVQFGSVNGASVASATVVASTNSHAHATISTAAADQLQVFWSFQTNATGTFSIQWAQNSSNANATRLNRGSSLRCQALT